MDAVTVERADGIVTVTMNRPGTKNALTGPMVEELRSTFDAVARRAGDRVLVLTGAGGDFCAGADLSAFSPAGSGSPEAALHGVRRVGDMVLSLYRLGKPTIAKVDGVAVGAGLGLAIACDLVVVSDRARLSMIFTRRALSPDGGTSWLLPRLVGPARAKELAYFGEMLDATTAVAAGLVNRVVPHDELDAFVAGWATRLAEGPALALVATKSLLDGAWDTGLSEALEHEAACQAANLSGPDVQEAVAAFFDKRPARFAAPPAGG